MTSGDIIWKSESPFAEPPRDFVKRAKRLLEGRVQAAYIFGSYLTSAFRPGSDVDLLLVKNTDVPFWERAREFDDLYDLYPRLDVLVYTPKELAAQLENPSGFWKSVKKTLRPL